MKAENLSGGLIGAFFRLKHLKPPLLPARVNGAETGLSITEAILLKKLFDGKLRGGLAEIQEEFHISKPAVSQMLGCLERKGFITRELDSLNRRHHILHLTEKARAAVRVQDQRIEDFFAELIRRFGEENARTMTELVARFAEIHDKLKAEFDQTEA